MTDEKVSRQITRAELSSMGGGSTELCEWRTPMDDVTMDLKTHSCSVLSTDCASNCHFASL